MRNALRAAGLVLIAMLCLWGGAADAERLIGVLMSGNTPYFQEIHAAFEREFRAAGVEGQIVLQKPGMDSMAWRNAARKLVAIESDVIVAYGAPATLAAMDETNKIPIVFGAVFDPDGLGIKAKNTTGMASGVPIAGAIKNLKAIKNFANLGVIYNTDEKDTELQFGEIKEQGARQGFQTVGFDVKAGPDPADVGSTEALFLTTSCAAMHCVQNFVEIARQSRIPTASMTGGGEETGIIMTLAADSEEQGAGVAKMVVRILGGESPSGVPVTHPKKVNFVLNMKEARAIGLKIPFAVLTSATKVIQ